MSTPSTGAQHYERQEREDRNAVLQIMKTGDIGFLRGLVRFASSLHTNDTQPMPDYYKEAERRALESSALDALFCVLWHIQGNAAFRYHVKRDTSPDFWNAFQERLRCAFESLTTGCRLLPRDPTLITSPASLISHMTRFTLYDCFRLHDLFVTGV